MNIFKRISTSLLLCALVFCSFSFATAQSVQASTTTVVTETISRDYFNDRYIEGSRTDTYSDGTTVEPKSDSFCFVKKQYLGEKVVYHNTYSQASSYTRVTTYRYTITSRY